MTVEAVTYHGRKAVRVVPAPAADAELVAPKNGEGGGFVVLPGTSFHNGSIEVDLAGKPRTGATADARGFVGVAFRVAANPSNYECIYIRPTNGRADDQVRRNHSTQYISMPEYEWSRLRRAHNACGWSGTPSEGDWTCSFRRLGRARVENGVGAGQP